MGCEQFSRRRSCVAQAVMLVVVSMGARPLMAQPFAYVTSQSADDVIVIDTETRQMTTTIPVGREPHAVALRQDGTRAFVSNRGSDVVSVIDRLANAVEATVNVGDYPTDVAVVATDQGEFAYVTNTFGGSVSVINTDSNAVVATIPVGAQPWSVTSDPNGELVYVAT